MEQSGLFGACANDDFFVTDDKPRCRDVSRQYFAVAGVQRRDRDDQLPTGGTIPIKRMVEACKLESPIFD